MPQHYLLPDVSHIGGLLAPAPLPLQELQVNLSHRQNGNTVT